MDTKFNRAFAQALELFEEEFGELNSRFAKAAKSLCQECRWEAESQDEGELTHHFHVFLLTEFCRGT